MAQTAKNFVMDSYQIISPNSPTVPLHGNDMSKGIQFTNELLKSYSGTGLLITVAKETSFTTAIGQSSITYAATGADVNIGRLANLETAWLLLEGVTYPLIPISKDQFEATYRYNPLVGLPRFAVWEPGTDITTITLYPASSQAYEIHIYGKYELSDLTENSIITGLPGYYERYAKLAVARDLSMYKGRSEAWTPKLDKFYTEAKEDMEAVSSINLAVESPNENQLNGAFRVRAGV